MKEYWEDTHIMYEEDEEDNKKIYWQDFLGGLILLSIIFFTGYGIVSFVKDVF
jgi:hypothetical protein